MTNFTITYKTNKKADLLEQAAGFPPFTRGYSVISKKVQISSSMSTDFTLTDYNDENIIQLFKEIISRQAKGEFSISLTFIGKVTEIIYLRVLRTLLAFVSDKLHNNAALIKFEFYGINSNEHPSLNTLVFANAGQLNGLIVNSTSEWSVIQKLIKTTPADSLYGSSYLEHETEILFFRLWKQIEESFV